MKFSFSGYLLRSIILLFLAGNTLLLILIIISGSTNSFPINHFYWVQGDTSDIPNAPTETRWTFWGACEVDNGVNNCQTNLSPAYPISPVDNFGTHTNVPSKFISNRDSFYYLTRFAFCFFWISLAFIGISFLLYVISWCSYEFTKVVFTLMFFGCLFNMCAVIFETAAAVLARDAFQDADRSAKLGPTLFGMSWASVFLSMVEFIFLCYEFGKRAWLKNTLATPTATSPTNFNDSRRFGWFSRGRRHDSMTNNNNNILVDEKIMSQGPYSTVGQPTQQTALPPQESQHKGINFFTIRRGHNPAEEDSI